MVIIDPLLHTTRGVQAATSLCSAWAGPVFRKLCFLVLSLIWSKPAPKCLFQWMLFAVMLSAALDLFQFLKVTWEAETCNFLTHWWQDLLSPSFGLVRNFPFFLILYSLVFSVPVWFLLSVFSVLMWFPLLSVQIIRTWALYFSSSQPLSHGLSSVFCAHVIPIVIRASHLRLRSLLLLSALKPQSLNFTSGLSKHSSGLQQTGTARLSLFLAYVLYIWCLNLSLVTC